LQSDAVSTEEAGFDAIQGMLNDAKTNEAGLPDAIVCASDLIAMGVLRALRQTALKVPDDIAVVGYDNIAVSAFTTPALTTVQQNTKLAGELLVSTLIKAISNEKVEDYLMPAEVIIRHSCGAKT
jgi:DNA-binding LacI/PurR family transcriptional regulator